MASENEQSVNMQNRSSITNGVVITVYVESPTTRSIKPSEDPRKKTKPHPRFRMAQTTGSQSSRGYDRRAQLLAYSRQLRENAQSQKNVQVQLPHSHSRPRNKKRRLLLAEPVRVCSSSTLMPPTSSIHFGYEWMEQSKGSEEIMNRSNKTKRGGNKCCRILRQLKDLLKKLSCKEMEW